MPTVETPPTLQAGGTLNPYEHLYVSREDVEDRLYSLLHQGEYCNVLSSRQVGKSSIVVKVGFRLQDEGARVAMIDLAGVLGSPESSEQWYMGFLGSIASALELGVNVSKWWNTVAEGTPNQRFLQFFREVAVGDAHAPLVIVLDEIDSTLKVPYTDDFFTAIRTMYNTRASVPAYRHTTFCLVGVASPNELIKDRRTTAYNVGTNLELRDFDPQKDDLTPLYAAVSPDPETGKRLVEAVFDWTDGHPYLTLWLCQEIVEQEIGTPEAVRKFLRGRYPSYVQVESDVHFQQISRFVGHRIPERIETLRLYSQILSGRKVRDEATPRHINLKLAGIVKRSPDNLLIVRNRIYREVFNREWVRGHFPLDWRRQLRRVGTALVVTSVIALMLLIYLRVTIGQRNLLEAQARQLESRQTTLERQAAELRQSRAELQMALAEAMYAGQEAEAASAKAVAAGERADSLRHLAEANATAATRAQALAVRRAYEADSIRVVEAKRREQSDGLLVALENLRKRDLALLRGDTLSRTVSEFEQSDRHDEAIVVAQRMLQEYRDANDPAKVAFALERIGGLHAQLRRFDTAMASLRSALAIRLREQPSSVALAETYEAIGEVAEKWGQDTVALTHYEAAESILRLRGAPEDRVRNYLKLARTRQQLHLHLASVAAYDSALVLLERIPLFSGTENERLAQRALVHREQAMVFNAMRDGDRYRRALRQADLLEPDEKGAWSFIGSGGVGYQSVHGLGIGISESILYTRQPFRPGLSVRGFWSFQDSSWTVSGGPTASYAPFRGVPLEAAVDLHLGTTGVGPMRMIPGLATSFTVNSWSAVTRVYWPAYDRRLSLEMSVGVNLGFSPRDGLRPVGSKITAPALVARSDSAAIRRTSGQR